MAEGGENRSAAMRPRTSGHVYSLVQRISVAEFGALVSIPAGGVGVSFGGNPQSLGVLGKNQAIRIVYGLVAAADTGSTGKLQLESLNGGVFVAPTQAIRRTFLAPVSKPILGSIGIDFGFSDDEFILGHDYSEINMAGGSPVLVKAFGVATNLDGAAAHNVACSIAVLAELYDVSG